jgi:tRNA-(ms[2]io[6]A)-hydroxylase
MLVAALIEARSCERFGLLAEHLQNREPALAKFFASLFESEARHHSTYIKFAHLFGTEQTVAARLEDLAAAEAQIIHEGHPEPRMHS